MLLAVQIVPGQHIAQALPLPMNAQFPALSQSRGSTSPGSSEIFGSMPCAVSDPR